MNKKEEGMSKETKEDSKSDAVEIPFGKYLGKTRSNPWIISTFVLGIVLVVFLIFSFTGSLTGNVVNAETAGKNVVDFINSNPALGAKVELLSTEREDSLYKVNVKFQGQEIPLYATLDGKFLVTNIVPLVQGVGSPEEGEPQLLGGKVDVSVDDDPVLGDKNAPITIIEFSDYQCPFCRKFWTETFSMLKKDYIETNKVKLVFRDFPLSFHPMAIPSAEAANCVREKGGDSAYYKMHDKMFKEQNELDGGDPVKGPVKSTVQYTNDDLKKWAKEIGYNIDSCLDSGKFKEEIQKDFNEGSAAGIQGTPGFFVNGIKLDGALPYEQFKQIIDAELAKTQTA
ncbi:MAG: thioredoxin domain-containing protein [Nanoarchaeota archaeon]